MVLASLVGRITKRRWSASLPSPETILRWHRELVPRKRAAFGKRPHRVRADDGCGGSRPDSQVGSREPEVGYRRIEGELLKVGRPCRLGGLLHEYARAA
jgi:hypothetical protein